MSNWGTAVVEGLTFLGGSTTAALVNHFGNRKHSEVVIEKDRASAVQLLTDAVTKLGTRVDALETDLNATREELAESKQEQSRISGLFRQAIQAIRDFIEGRTPHLSDELKAEIEGSK